MHYTLTLLYLSLYLFDIVCLWSTVLELKMSISNFLSLPEQNYAHNYTDLENKFPTYCPSISSIGQVGRSNRLRSIELNRKLVPTRLTNSFSDHFRIFHRIEWFGRRHSCMKSATCIACRSTFLGFRLHEIS